MPSRTSRWRSRTTTRWSSPRRRRSRARWWPGAVSCGAAAITTRRTCGTAVGTRSTTLTIRATVSARRTTRGPAHTLAALWLTVPTAAPAWPSATTHGPARILAEPSPTVRTARAAPHRRTTRARARMARRARARMCTGTGERRASSAVISGRRRRGTTSNVTGKTTRTTQTSGGGEAISRTGRGSSSTVARTGSGDVYAGHDGNVYRKQGDSWQKYDRGGWNSVGQPTPQQRQQAQASAQARASGWDSTTAQQVSRDSAARAEGNQRTRDASSVRSGSSSRAGSYRAGGGRAGGRR